MPGTSSTCTWGITMNISIRPTRPSVTSPRLGSRVSVRTRGSAPNVRQQFAHGAGEAFDVGLRCVPLDRDAQPGVVVPAHDGDLDAVLVVEAALERLVVARRQGQNGHLGEPPRIVRHEL